MLRREVLEPAGAVDGRVDGTRRRGGGRPGGLRGVRQGARRGRRLELLGIGTDGHIGFNEPCSSLASRTRIKTLTEQTRVDNARFFEGDIDQVPHHVITQGIGTILEARHLVLLATGQEGRRGRRDGGGAGRRSASRLRAAAAPARHGRRRRGRGVQAEARRTTSGTRTPTSRSGRGSRGRPAIPACPATPGAHARREGPGGWRSAARRCRAAGARRALVRPEPVDEAAADAVPGARDRRARGGGGRGRSRAEAGRLGGVAPPGAVRLACSARMPAKPAAVSSPVAVPALESENMPGPPGAPKPSIGRRSPSAVRARTTRCPRGRRRRGRRCVRRGAARSRCWRMRRPGRRRT
ncbi:Glucosamine-6-phosphate deaminase [Streptomyces glaucescens]